MRRVPLYLPVLLLLTLSAAAWADPQVTTDKPDYAPGETVQITGTGFHATETVYLRIQSSDGQIDESGSATTDANGGFTAQWLVTDLWLNNTFLLTADCPDGLHAERTFTDSGALSYTGTPPSTAEAGGTPVSFTQAVTAPKNNGSFTASLKVAGTGVNPIPSSWVSTDPASLSFATGNPPNGADDTKSWTVSFTVPSGTAAGTYTANIQANPSITGVGVSSGTAVTLTVTVPCTAPAISTNPTDQTVCEGDSVSFTAAASGNPDPTVQWQVSTNGGVSFSDIGGATSTTLSFPATTAQNGYKYRAVFTNTCTPSTATSSAAALTVTPKAKITQQPVGTTVCAGSAVNLSVTATGAVSYQWKKDGNDITGATGSSYSIASAQVGDSGSYTVVVTGACGPSVTSDAANVTVNPTTSISADPESKAVCPGDSVTFSVTADGTNLSYQWRKGGNAIAGATSSSYTITGVTAGDAGSYDCVVHGDCGDDITSHAAVLTVNMPPVINTQPTTPSDPVCKGGSVTFTVDASGTGLTYQWYKGTDLLSNGTTADGTVITGADTNSLRLDNVQISDAGSYHVTVRGTCNPDGVSSDPVTLTVITPPSITVQPIAPQTNPTVGQSVNFTVTADSGGGSLSYQWRKNGANIPGATSDNLVINSVLKVVEGDYASDEGDYDVVVTNCSGSVTSNAVHLTVDKADQTINWDNPADIIYGTPLGATQLNATVTGPGGKASPGALTYDPLATTILNAGDGQTLTVTAAETGNYNGATATVTINVLKANQTITWSDPADIVYGTALSDTQLNATVNVVGPAPAGGLTYDPAAGTQLNAGTHTLNVTAAATNNYNEASASVTIKVNPAPLTVTANNATKSLNAPNPPLTGTLTGVVNGDNITATYTTTATQYSPIGTYPITPVLSDPGDRLGNYTVTSNNGTLTIQYASYSGILPPINQDGSSVFKQGSTVPAKFRVFDANGVSIGTPGVVTSFKLVQIISGTLVSTVNEDVISTTPDTAFRWDPVAQQWIFNINTKSLSKNYTYRYQITLNDGSTIGFQFGLK